jgi:hypothetical protein
MREVREAQDQEPAVSKGCAAFAVLLWLLFGWAVFDMTHGNPTAINGVIGAGAGAVLATVGAIMLRDL